jgi:LacI family transcriptional regulator
MDHSKRWEDYADDLARWIAALPKPAGLMLCSDQIGPVTMEACRRAGVVVPDEVAVIGVDDDEPLCEVAAPGLSSVWPDHERVGYEAAALLDKLMRGGKAPAGPIYVPPRGVVTRRSSDVLALDDREAAAAVRVIREHACDPAGLTIDDVAARVTVSRSVLQRRFKAATGRQPAVYLQALRIDAAKTLLERDGSPVQTISAQVGYEDVAFFRRLFRRLTSMTPAEYRAHFAPLHVRGRLAIEAP